MLFDVKPLLRSSAVRVSEQHGRGLEMALERVAELFDLAEEDGTPKPGVRDRMAIHTHQHSPLRAEIHLDESLVAVVHTELEDTMIVTSILWPSKGDSDAQN